MSYWKEDVEKAVCYIVVLDYTTGEINSVGEIKFPYISGYLAFRELPLVIECNEKLSVKPDLYVFDGNGYLHQRHMGIATHASFYLNKPTISVAKIIIRSKMLILLCQKMNKVHLQISSLMVKFMDVH